MRLIPSIKTLPPKKLIGQKLVMSISDNKTGQLWGGFAPRIKEIKNRVGNVKFSLQVYPNDHFRIFDPNKSFEKWALVEVSDFKNIPPEMESFKLEGGRYAVFGNKGSSADNSVFQYIFEEWLPNAGYQLDERPHFEVLGEKYKNNDPESEEEIWIPIR
jgi:AraC family transcriptional regulator